MTVETVQVPAFRPFAVEVARVRQLSPSFVRVTFAGDDLDEFASAGADQRIKVVLPLPGRGVRDCPLGPDWYGSWRALPPERRNPLRSYTVRAARPLEREVDVDFVLHGPTGPAGAWAAAARPGDPLVLVGPNARFSGDAGGVEWRPPAGATRLVLGGDETAVPAICSIVESLPDGVDAHAVLEVPEAGDLLDVAAPVGARLTWLPRTTFGPTRPHGELLTAAVLRAVGTAAGTPAPRTGPAEPVEPDALDPEALDPEALDPDALVWDVPGDPSPAGNCYVWLAGEAGVVTSLRRQLLRDGLDRDCVAFMGYWRRGRSLG